MGPMSDQPRYAPDARARTRAILDLAIRLAMALWGSGAGAQETTEAMTAVSRTYGLRNTDADVTHTVLSLTWTNPSTDESYTRSHNLRARQLDYSRLSAAAALYRQIVEKRIGLADAARRLSRIRASRPLSPRWVQEIGWGLVGAGATVLLGGGIVVAAVAFVAAVALNAIMAALQRGGVPLLFRTFLGGAIGPVAALIAQIIQPDASPTLVVVATVIVLLAGVTVFGGVQDILTAFYVTGLARLTEAIVATVGIAAGVIATSLLLDRLGAPVEISVTEARPDQLPAVAVAAAVVMALGFSIATQVPWRALGVVAVLAALAETITLLGTDAGLGPIWSVAAASVAVGFTASLLTRTARTPALPMIVAPLVPMLPGLMLFDGLMLIAASDVRGLFDVFLAAAIAASIAAGSILGHYLVRPLGRRGSRATLSKL
jgi:uncharacterized membrane protein YjjP (DUF1212 family)